MRHNSLLRIPFILMTLVIVCITDSAAVMNEPLAMILDCGEDGAAHIVYEGVARKAGVASDLYQAEHLFVTRGKILVLWFGSGEKTEITSRSEVEITAGGIKLVTGTGLASKGQEDILLANANLSGFNEAFGNVGALRDTGNRKRAMQDENSVMQEEGRRKSGKDRLSSAQPANSQRQLKPATMSRPEKSDLAAGGFEESDSFSGTVDSFEMPSPGELKKKEIAKPGVWTFNSFYDQAFLVLACRKVPTARYYMFTVTDGQNKAKYVRSLAAYVEISKQGWKLKSGTSYTLTLKAFDTNNRLATKNTIKFTLPRQESIKKLDNFFLKPPMIRGLILEKTNMLREALYLYKTLRHVSPELSGGLADRISRLEDSLSQR